MGSNYNSHNFKVDRGATKKVLAQSWNKLFITKKVSQKISFTRKELSKLRRSKLGDFIYESAMRWLDYSRREKVCVYDVLAVSAAMDEGFVKFKEWKDDLISYDVDSHLKKRILQIIK